MRRRSPRRRPARERGTARELVVTVLRQVQAEVPSEDELAASAVAATANDPLAAVDGRAVVPVVAGGTA